MEITRREIIVSIAIAAFLLAFGFVISTKITDARNDRNAEYQKAVHIEDPEIFQYAMETNVGNAFVYGQLESVDTVTYEEIGGEYLYVEKVEEWYERHEEWVTEKDSKGNEERKKKVWYSWEIKGRDSRHAEEIKFCGIVFPYEKIDLPSKEYIETINGGKAWSLQSGERVKVRYIYYGVPTDHTGTIYTRLGGGTISSNSVFCKDNTIEQALDRYTTNVGNLIFWIVWIVFIAMCVIGFCYLDNRWLKD